MTIEHLRMISKHWNFSCPEQKQASTQIALTKWSAETPVLSKAREELKAKRNAERTLKKLLSDAW
jgi:hypothetical protein